MPTTKWILPEGIEDILPEQAYWLEMKRREVIDIFISLAIVALLLKNNPPFSHRLNISARISLSVGLRS